MARHAEYTDNPLPWRRLTAEILLQARREQAREPVPLDLWTSEGFELVCAFNRISEKAVRPDMTGVTWRLKENEA